MVKRLRLGIIGLNHPHTGGHVQTFKLIPEVGVAALYDPDEKVLTSWKDKVGAQHAASLLFTDLDGMLRKADLDLAMVLLRNSEAPAAAEKAVRAGLHVMVEKPCARTAAEFQRVVRAAKAKKVKVGVGYCWPFNPISRDVRAFIAGGLLGKPYSIEARMNATQVILRNPKHYLFNRAVSGGGILSWLGCHWLDLMHFLLQSEVAEVSAIIGEVGGNGIDVEDAASVSLRYENGVIGSLHAGYFLKRGDKDLFMGIRGGLGAVWWTPGEPTVKLVSDSPEWSAAPERTFSYVFPPCPAYSGQWGLEHMKDFVSAVRTGRDPFVTGENAVRVLRILDAAYESARSGRTVSL